MKQVFCIILSIALAHSCAGQAKTKDYEFPKGWVLNLDLFQGMSTRFNSMPDLYLGELRLSPQYTIVPQRLRLGASASADYNNKKVSGLAGVNLSLKIKTLKLEKLNGSALNVQWVLENLWGTNKQQLFGGGLKTEIGQMLLLSLMSYRDYNLNNWRMQVGVGVNFLRKKVPVDPI